MGYHYNNSRNSNTANYNTSYYTFFRERTSRPKIDVSLARSDGRVGFEVKVQRNGIRRPSADCNGTQYNFEKRNHDAEIDFLQINTPYSFYPFAINQYTSKGAYIIQRDSRLREVDKFDGTTSFLASIRIRGDGFEMEKDYVLTTNLSELRTKRLNLNELILPENVTFSIEEIKEPSLWRRFLSSFGVTRTRIPK